MAPLLYPPTEKDTSHWGRLPNSGRLLIKEAGTLAVMLCPPPPGSGATITPGGWVIRSWTRAICVPALHYHRLPELAAYSEEPQAIIQLLTNIMHSHQPNWNDCHQLMSTLFNSDEHQSIPSSMASYPSSTADCKSGAMGRFENPGHQPRLGSKHSRWAPIHPAHETSHPGGSPP
jgi:hypothetical protein